MRAPAAIILFLCVGLVAHSQELHISADATVVTFRIRNFGLQVLGTLGTPKGKVYFDPGDPSRSSFLLEVESNSIDTGIDLRDHHLKSDDYFAVSRYPSLTFESARILKTKINNQLVVTGRLTIKGTAMEIQIPIKVTPSGNGYLFKGMFTLNRHDYGVGKNSVSLGDEVMVDFAIATSY